jgi:hypothetical protein
MPKSRALYLRLAGSVLAAVGICPLAATMSRPQ